MMMDALDGNLKALDYFAQAPVFTHEEFVSARAGKGRSVHTANNILAHHVGAGHVLRVRRGVYATVPRGVSPDAAVVDPYLLATRLTANAVVAYHAALQFHGKAYSVSNRFAYLTRQRARKFAFRGAEFVPVLLPVSLRSLPDAGGGVVELRHAGGTARVTTLERTLVDVLDAPEHGGGWEELWRSLESVEFFESRRGRDVRGQAWFGTHRCSRRVLSGGAPGAADGRGAPPRGATNPRPATASVSRPAAPVGPARFAMEPGSPGARALPRVGRGPVNLLLPDLQREAAATGFPAEMLEKTLRLLSLLMLCAAIPSCALASR